MNQGSSFPKGSVSPDGKTTRTHPQPWSEAIDDFSAAAPPAPPASTGCDLPTPSEQSALVASGAACGDIAWTHLSAGVGGMMVQQAQGQTPAFVAGAASTNQVAIIDKADDTAKWANGIPLVEPAGNGNVSQLLKSDGAATPAVSWVDGVPLLNPTIPSALVASAADTPVWTSDISPGVGGVLVQQAAGDTPEFVAGTASTKQVFSKAASTAGWEDGIPLPEPVTAETYPVSHDGATIVYEAIVDVSGIESDITAIETILGTQSCTVDTYLQSDGAGGFQCGLKAATAATASTLVARDSHGDIQAVNAGFSEVYLIAGGGGTNGFLDASKLELQGVQVVTTRQSPVPDATGGATVDAEARTAINDLLARLRIHGLIA